MPSAAEQDLRARMEHDFQTMEDPYQVLDHQVDAHIETHDETMVRRFLIPVVVFGVLFVFAVLLPLVR
jgi:hypothetical protein